MPLKKKKRYHLCNHQILEISWDMISNGDSENGIENGMTTKNQKNDVENNDSEHSPASDAG